MHVFTKGFSKKERKDEETKSFWHIPPHKETEEMTYGLKNILKIHIKKDLYTIEEPILTEEEKKTFTSIRESLYELINFKGNGTEEDYLEKSIRLIALELDLPIKKETQKKILYLLKKEFFGFGKIEQLMQDPLVERIEWKNFEEPVRIKHRIHGICTTTILLNKDDAQWITKKIQIITEQEKTAQKKPSIGYSFTPNNSFTCEKKYEKNFSPSELLRARKISPEMLSYLWILIEKRKPFFIKDDPKILYCLSFFLPAYQTIYSNAEDFPPNPFTTTIIGESSQEQDTSFIRDWTPNTPYTGNLLATTTEDISEENKSICYTKEGKVISIKEDGKELFLWKDNKFFLTLEKSTILSSEKELITECKRRSLLLAYLIKRNLKDEDFKRICAVYYENPQAVLKKVGLL